MQPRLKSSTRWTEMPKDYLQQIRQVCQESFEEQVNSGEFIAEGRIYPGEILLRLGFLAKGRLRQANFEVSMAYSKEQNSVIEVIHFAVDVAASMMADYFEDSEVEMPRDWRRFSINGREVFVQFSTTNSELEKEADRLLDETDENLMQGELPNEGDAVKNLFGVNEGEETLH